MRTAQLFWNLLAPSDGFYKNPSVRNQTSTQPEDVLVTSGVGILIKSMRSLSKAMSNRYQQWPKNGLFVQISVKTTDKKITSNLKKSVKSKEAELKNTDNSWHFSAKSSKLQLQKPHKIRIKKLQIQCVLQSEEFVTLFFQCTESVFSHKHPFNMSKSLQMLRC